jgi:hypothetical protein
MLHKTHFAPNSSLLLIALGPDCNFPDMHVTTQKLSQLCPENSTGICLQMLLLHEHLVLSTQALDPKS